MAEAAPASPQAPGSAPAPGSTSNGTSNGMPHGTGQSPAKGPPAPLAPTKPPPGRSTTGQFLPRDGTASAGDGEAGKTQAQAAQKPPDEWRYKGKLKVLGVEEDADLDQAEVTRRLQKLRALEKKHLAEFSRNDEAARRLVEMARADPAAFLRELGQDPDAYARKRLAEEARLGAMTEEEKAIHERDVKISEYEAREKQRAEAETAQAAQAKHDRLVAGYKATLNPALAALAAAGVPNDHDALAALVETMKLTLEPGVSLADVTPEELAADTLKRLDSSTERYLARLDIPTLIKRLGPARITGILEASLADFDKSQSFEASPREAQVAPGEGRPRPERVDERELNRRMAELRRGGGR